MLGLMSISARPRIRRGARLALSLLAACALHAHAADPAPAGGNAVERTATKAGNATERTAKKAANATERGAKRAVSAVEHAAKTTDRALNRAAEKTEHWVKEKTK